MATQLSTLRVDDQVCNAIRTEKNTFVHFVDEDSLAEKLLILQRRRLSEPPMHLDDQSLNTFQTEKESWYSDDETSLSEEESNTPSRGEPELDQSSMAHVDDQTWNAVPIQKNTFLHFVDEASLVEKRMRLFFRRHSDPVCWTESQETPYTPQLYASTEAPDSAWTSEAADSVASEADRMEFTNANSLEYSSEGTNAGTSSCEMLRENEGKSREEEALEVCGDTFADDVKDTCEQSCSKGKANRIGRPCKGKRNRFRKFVARLEEQVKANPHGFDLENIEWPAVLLEGDFDRIRAKVLNNLFEYRNGLLAEFSSNDAKQRKVTLSLAQFVQA